MLRFCLHALRAFCYCTALLVGTAAHAQDVITDLQGHELPGRVLNITPAQVIYRPAGADSLAAPVTLDKATLSQVRFASGTREQFGPNPNVAQATPPDTTAGEGLSPEALYRRGQRDAKHLHSYKGAFWGTFATTAVTLPMLGVGGIVTGGAIAATRPKAAANPKLSPVLLRQSSYVEGYEKQAQRRKLQRAAAGYGAAWAAGLAAAVVIISVVAVNGFH